MNTPATIISLLQQSGHRITAARRTMIELFFQHTLPLEAKEIKKKLAGKNIFVNKTTIYREIQFLIKQRIIKTIQLGEDKTRYELANQDHHHHLVCIECEKIQDVLLDRELEQEEKVIAQSKQFKVLHHALEFFGLCATCQPDKHHA